MRPLCMSSIVGIGAALSAVLWLVVFWFIAQAAVQEKRSGFIEPPKPTQREKRRDKRLDRQLAFRNRSLKQVEVEVAAAARPVATRQEVDALTWSTLTRTDSPATDV
jgi:hypothetical protein